MNATKNGTRPRRSRPAAAIAAVILSSCVQPLDSWAQLGQYVGQMYIAYDTGDTGAVAAPAASTVGVLVSIQPPYQIPPDYQPQVQGSADKNPFFIYITPYAAGTGPNLNLSTPGHVQFLSATPQRVPDPYKPSPIWITDLWSLALQGQYFQGTYTPPFSVDANNFFVSQELGSPFVFNPGAPGGGPAQPCVAFLNQPATMQGLFDPANQRIHIEIAGHGGGYTRGICIEDLRVYAIIDATLDPTIPAPRPQLEQ